jgi:hypothetical protein
MDSYEQVIDYTLWHTIGTHGRTPQSCKPREIECIYFESLLSTHQEIGAQNIHESKPEVSQEYPP